MRNRLYIGQGEKVFFLLFCLFLINTLCVVRLINVSLYGKYGPAKKPALSSTFFRERSDIVDRNDVLLATNLTTFSMYADPKTVLESGIDVGSIAKQIDDFIGDNDYKNILKSLQKDKRFVWIKRNLPPKQYAKIVDMGIPGISFIREEKRVYPHGNLVAHLLGQVDVDGNGVSGVEKYFNKNLLTKTKIIQEPLRLSIDIRIQHAARSELLAAIERYRAEGGGAIVLDAKTGEILAIVSLPDFDPNNIKDTKSENMFNRSTLGVYEIGSIFKIFISALAIDSGVLTLDEKIDIKGPLKIGKNHLLNDMIKINDKANIETILGKSSNIGMVKIAMRLKESMVKNFLEIMGFCDVSDLELPEKSMPLCPKKWTDTTLLTMSYGYGIASTIAHIAESTATLINGGYRHRSTIIKTEKIREGSAILKKGTSDIMRKLLYNTVKNGTGKKADVPGYCVGGKTGTSNKIIDGKYNKNSSITSFVGAFPMYDPRYVIIVTIDNPKQGDYAKKMTGGLVSAPVVSNIIIRMTSLLNVVPDLKRCDFYR